LPTRHRSFSMDDEIDPYALIDSMLSTEDTIIDPDMWVVY
jgi:hypothetical protein